MNSGEVKTYDPKLVTITFGGIIFFDFPDGDFVEFSSDDAFESIRGADGSEERVNKNVFSGDLTLTLKQTSRTNDDLTQVLNADKLLNNGIRPLQIKDLRGTTLLFSPRAWIMKTPDFSLGDSLNTRGWTFRLTNLEPVLGGNFT